MVNIDTQICVGPQSFRLRSAALILENGKILMAKNKNYTPYYTIGGGVHIGESAEKAAVREAWEETGCHYEIDRLLVIQERFFEFDGMHNHEIIFYYLMKELDSNIPDGVQGDHDAETLHWLPVDALSQYPIVPDFLKTLLQTIPESVQHIVTVE